MAAHPPKSGEAAGATLHLTVLGTRGSMAVSESGREIFGGATSCYMVQAGADCVFLDAGSGLLAAPVDLPKPPLILLSHMHLDHIMGLGMYRRLSQRGLKTRLCLPTDNIRRARRLLDTLYSPPFWPVSLRSYAGDLELVPARFPMEQGSIRIDGIWGSHPGGSLVFRLSCGNKSLVYATDFESEDEAVERLADFARDTDLLLYDGQYLEEEYRNRRGFGHSTAGSGIALMERCGAKRLLLIHHDPDSTDEELLRREARIGSERVRYARQGEVIEI